MADQDPNETHTGMLGDGTEEQNLNQPGDPSKRITEDEVDAAFGQEGDQPKELPPVDPDTQPENQPAPIGDPDPNGGQVSDPEPVNPPQA